MENIDLIESFSEFKDDKSIDRVTLMSILEEVFRSALKRKFGSDDNFDIIINPDKGDLEIWRNRIVVADGMSEDDNEEIEFSKKRSRVMEETIKDVYTGENKAKIIFALELLQQNDAQLNQLLRRKQNEKRLKVDFDSPSRFKDMGCSVCGQRTELKRCGQCNKTKYCSTRCQTIDWNQNNHSKHCY